MHFRNLEGAFQKFARRTSVDDDDDDSGDGDSDEDGDDDDKPRCGLSSPRLFLARIYKLGASAASLALDPLNP